MQYTLDIDSVKDITRAESTWARECGQRVLDRRETLGLSRRSVARAIDISTQTIRRIEIGEIVPLDYLRLALAFILVCEVDDLFPAPHRSVVQDLMDVPTEVA